MISDDITRRDAAKLLGLSLAPTIGVDRPASAPDLVPDLAGRAVIVYSRGRPVNIPIILTECRFEHQGGRMFLVGTNQHCRSSLVEWTDGTTRCVAWNAVDEYIVFDSLTDYYASQGQPPSEAEDREAGA